MLRFYLHVLQLVTLAPGVAIAAGLHWAPHLCDRVDYRMPGRISYPGSLVYNNSESTYYTGQERGLRPGCIFRPETTADVSQFVKVVNEDERACHTPQFAVRGGGHTLFTGAANINGGVTVDLRALNTLVISEDQKTASVGGGAIWSDIYPQLVPHNLTVMGSRVPGIAVGGFSTGGGLNFLSRKHGFDCDNIYGYEVVLASGEVVYASSDSHRDLWLALKGGSNNFGIVTRFDFATFPQGLMWGGIIQFNYTDSVLDAQAKAFSNFMRQENFDSAADMAIILDFQSGGAFSVANSLFYTDAVENPPVYQPFTSIPSMTPALMGLISVSDLVVDFGKSLPNKLPRHVLPNGLFTYQGIELVYSFQNSDADLYSEIFETWEAGTQTLAHIEGLQVQFLVQPQPVTNGTNSLGLPPGKTDSVISVITAAYENACDDDFVLDHLQDMVDTHVGILRRKGLYLPFKYLNYADKSQDPIGSYGRDNKDRLQETSRRYDPRGLFQTGLPGGFKLFE